MTTPETYPTAHPGQLQDYRGAAAFAFTLGKDSAAVLAGNGPHDEKTEASSLHMTQRAVGNAVKAFENSLQLFRRDPYPLVADTQRHLFSSGVSRRTEIST